MRIIGGELRGRTFRSPQFKGRPTMDRAKEGLFNILSHRIDFTEIRVADLFSGTGAISFEFISRGCPSVTAVEQNRQHAAGIQSSAERLGISQLEVICAKVERFLYSGRSYELIFADPPYDWDKMSGLPQQILESPLLAPGGMLIVEHHLETNFLQATPFEKRTYGGSSFSFFMGP